jgi:hypothetical protein
LETKRLSEQLSEERNNELPSMWSSSETVVLVLVLGFVEFVRSYERSDGSETEVK